MIEEHNRHEFDKIFGPDEQEQARGAAPRPTDQIICIVDRSGSMGEIKGDAEGGLNEFIEQQRQVPGDAQFTLVQFDSGVEWVYNREPLEQVEPYTMVPRSMTALFDAVGQTLNHVLSSDIDSDTKVIINIVTDGKENASREYSKQQINNLISQCQDNDWEVTFLAADQDAMQEGGSIGVAQNATLDWDKSGKGIRDAYTTASVNAADYRTNKKTAGTSVRDYTNQDDLSDQNDS